MAAELYPICGAEAAAVVQAPASGVGGAALYGSLADPLRPAFLLRSAGRGGRAAFHATALHAGGRDNGGPGIRPDSPGYYAALAIDPDGYRVEAFCRSANH